MIPKTTGTDLRAQKNAIRAEYKKRRAALPENLKAAYDTKICTQFLASMTYRYAEILLLYAPMPGEIDILPIAKDALRHKKTVAFPRCHTESCEMTYHIVTSLDDLKPGAYHILEPDAALPIYHAEHPIHEELRHAVCLVPGLTFDTEGYRIGYGKGYYDRYLPEFSGVRVGTIYTDFILPVLPRGRFDLSVDILVTEKGVQAVHAK